MQIRNIGAAAVLLATSVAAHAATVTETKSFAEPETNLPATTALLFFNGFDTSLGTLTGVSATYDFLASIAAGGINVTTGSTGNYVGFIDGNVVVTNLPAAFYLNRDINGPTATCPPIGTAGIPCRATYGADSEAFQVFRSATDVSPFAQVFAAIVNITTNVTNQTGSNFFRQPSTFWTGSGSITFTYTYDPAVTPPDVNVVPVPAALPLLLGGLMAFGALRRRGARAA